MNTFGSPPRDNTSYADRTQLCRHCKQPAVTHVDLKCIFDSTEYERMTPGEELRNIERKIRDTLQVVADHLLFSNADHAETSIRVHMQQLAFTYGVKLTLGSHVSFDPGSLRLNIRVDVEVK